MVLGFVFCSLGPGVLDLYVPILPCDLVGRGDISVMPGMLCVLSMREGLVVRNSSRMFLPLVGSRTAW